MRLVASSLALAFSSVSLVAVAAEPGDGSVGVALAAPGPSGDAPEAAAKPARPADARDAAPILGATMSAFGAPGWSAGASGYAGALGLTRPSPGAAAAEPTGGVRVWASPVDRVTILFEADKPFYRAIAPAVTGMVRLLGDRRRGFALGAGLSYRAESFAELGGELEGGLLLSFARSRFHSDMNLVVGGGLEEEAGGEADAEAKLRLGYDVTSFLRIGADGRFRHRVAGSMLLPGGRTYDAVGGAEALFGYKNLFAALAFGPSTVGVASGYALQGTGTLGVAIF